jgi:hypothetical protein
MIDFSDYQCFDPGVYRPLSEVTKAEAKKHFDRLMREKNERISQFKALVARSGIDLNGSENSIQKLNDWFFQNVEPSEKEPERLKPIWYSVVNDIALFLGEEIIRKAPNLRWEVLLSGKNNLSYQRPVITGFSKVKNPKYNIDLDWTIGVYGHRIIAKNEGERDLFVRIVKSAVQDA